MRMCVSSSLCFYVCLPFFGNKTLTIYSYKACFLFCLLQGRKLQIISQTLAKPAETNQTKMQLKLQGAALLSHPSATCWRVISRLEHTEVRGEHGLYAIFGGAWRKWNPVTPRPHGLIMTACQIRRAQPEHNGDFQEVHAEPVIKSFLWLSYILILPIS